MNKHRPLPARLQNEAELAVLNRLRRPATEFTDLLSIKGVAWRRSQFVPYPGDDLDGLWKHRDRHGMLTHWDSLAELVDEIGRGKMGDVRHLTFADHNRDQAYYLFDLEDESWWVFPTIEEARVAHERLEWDENSAAAKLKHQKAEEDQRRSELGYGSW